VRSSSSAWSSQISLISRSADRVIASRHLSIPLNGIHAASSVSLSLRVSAVSVTAQALDLKSQVWS
jgi:hypothetical protein